MFDAYVGSYFLCSVLASPYNLIFVQFMLSYQELKIHKL